MIRIGATNEPSREIIRVSPYFNPDNYILSPVISPPFFPPFFQPSVNNVNNSFKKKVEFLMRLRSVEKYIPLLNRKITLNHDNLRLICHFFRQPTDSIKRSPLLSSLCHNIFIRNIVVVCYK